MRVLFDGYWLRRGPRANRTVQREMILAWAETFPQDDLAILVRHGDAPLQDFPSDTVIHQTRLPLQVLTNGWALPRLGSRIGADLLIAHNFGPWWGNSALFIHDLLFIDHPEWFTVAENLYFRCMPVTARGARAVLTSSHSEAARISRILGRDVTAVGLAMNSSLITASSSKPRLAEGIHDFGLTVGRLNKRKNLARTLQAAVESGRFSPHSPLVVVGEASGKLESLPAGVERALDSGTILLARGISDAELKWLYTHATLFLFLSLDEGFGLPCLEARTYGTPSIVSDIPVFREIMADKATYVSPLKIDAIAAAIRNHVVTEPQQPIEPPTWHSVVRRMRSAAGVERQRL